MKKTFPLLPALLTTMFVGCGKYDSLAQAKTACDEWSMKGERISYSLRSTNGDTKETFAINRECRREAATNQYLGYEGKYSSNDLEQEGEEVYWSNAPEADNFIVVKNFYY